jgi:hypothetical protein
MRVQNERSTSITRTPQPTPRRPAENAFTPAFLSAHRAQTREVRDGGGGLSEPARTLRSRALFAGPWDVEPIQPQERTEGTLYAIVRRAEPLAQGGGAVALFHDRTTALLTAAALSILATPNPLHVNTDERRGRKRRYGPPLHDGRPFLGHLTPKLCPGKAEEEAGLLNHLHALRTLAATPEALSLLVQALDPETLPILGRALMRRVQ